MQQAGAQRQIANTPLLCMPQNDLLNLESGFLTTESRVKTEVETGAIFVVVMWQRDTFVVGADSIKPSQVTKHTLYAKVRQFFSSLGVSGVCSWGCVIVPRSSNITFISHMWRPHTHEVCLLAALLPRPQGCALISRVHTPVKPFLAHPLLQPGYML